MQWSLCKDVTSKIYLHYLDTYTDMLNFAYASKELYRIFKEVKNNKESKELFEEYVSELKFVKASDDPYRALLYVQNHTHDICLAVVRRCSHALRLVRSQTPEICREAIWDDPEALEDVRDPHMRERLKKEFKL